MTHVSAVATKQGILLATITHHDIVPASYLTCLLPKRTIYGRLKYFISITYKLVSLGTHLTRGTLVGRGCSSTQSTPLNTPLVVVIIFLLDAYITYYTFSPANI